MTHFKDAIQAGLLNATSAEAADNEILSVLHDLTNDVEAASSGAATLDISVKIWDGLVSLASRAKLDNSPMTISLISTADQSKRFQIATYRKSVSGFPIVITAFGTTLTAGDAEGLQNALAGLFERPEVGRYLLQLMNGDSQET